MPNDLTSVIPQLERLSSVTRPCTLTPRRDDTLTRVRSHLRCALARVQPGDDEGIVELIRAALREIEGGR